MTTANHTTLRLRGNDSAISPAEFVSTRPDDSVSTPPPFAVSEVVLRPERFITPEVNGMTIPVNAPAVNPQGRTWYTFVAGANGELASGPLLGPNFEFNEIRYRFAPFPESPPPDELRTGWSTAAMTDWVNGVALQPNPAITYVDLVQFIAKSVEFAPGYEVFAGVVALWIILTYVTPLFSAVPYIHLHGTPGTGKSVLLRVIDELAFRPLLVEDITSAAMFRWQQSFGGTLLIDEAEKFVQTNDLGMLLNSGYRRGGRVMRTGHDGQIAGFQVFGPKVLGSIKPLNDALASRCIRIPMVPAAKPITPPDPQRAAQLRDSLHLLAIGSAFELRDIVESPVTANVSNRNADLWWPLICIANWLEQYKIAGVSNSIATIAERDSRERLANRTSPEVEALLRVLVTMRAHDVRPTPLAVLKEAQATRDDLFKEEVWKPQMVSNRLAAYGVPGTQKINGRRVFSMPATMILDLIARHGLNLDAASREEDA